MRVVPGSNPVVTSGLDLFRVVPDSTLPRFVNTGCLLPVGVLHNVSVKFELTNFDILKFSPKQKASSRGSGE